MWFKRICISIITLATFITDPFVYSDVLFIGNSLTLRNNLGNMFKKISNDEVVVRAIPSVGINYHSRSFYTNYLLDSRKWDTVVIQGRSLEFAKHTYSTNVVPFLRSLCRHNNTLLFETWGYKNGFTSGVIYAPTYNRMQELIKRGYDGARDILRNEGYNIDVAYVGESWKAGFDTQNFKLHTLDNIHPNNHGTYQAAVMIYTAIYEKKLLNEYRPSGISKTNARKSRNIARNIFVELGK